jgi:hypothetical protein
MRSDDATLSRAALLRLHRNEAHGAQENLDSLQAADPRAVVSDVSRLQRRWLRLLLSQPADVFRCRGHGGCEPQSLLATEDTK